jgi:hypothetical protein
MPRRRPPKYHPLADYLAALTVDEVRLTFPEIEAILGEPLPVTARRSVFWVNQSGSPSWRAARSWVSAGWCVLRTELQARPPTVTFARVAPDLRG